MLPQNAVAALADADGANFQGRLLHVLPAQPEPGSSTGGGGGDSGGGGAGDSSFKASKDAKRRAGAGSEFEESSVWNTLFVRADTAVATLAERRGVSKAEVLDGDGKSMAVKQALAEAQLIAETKRFLEEEGVRLPTLESALEASGAAGSAVGAAPLGVKRSTTVIIVKNLPFAAELAELRAMFGRYGALIRLVMPPSRALAIVEYGDARTAKYVARDILCRGVPSWQFGCATALHDAPPLPTTLQEGILGACIHAAAAHAAVPRVGAGRLVLVPGGGSGRGGGSRRQRRKWCERGGGAVGTASNGGRRGSSRQQAEAGGRGGACASSAGANERGGGGGTYRCC